MPQRITPSGEIIKTGGTKSFNQIQAENAAALKAKLVTTTTCGVEVKIKTKPAVISDSILNTISLEKVDV